VQYALALAPVLILVPIIAFLVPVLIRLLRSSQPSELTTEWFESFHLSSYAPMKGLLAQDDFQFLSRQPGFDRSLHRKLRRDRLRIFREYLNRLIADYNRLDMLANFLVTQANEDQSELFARLLALRFNFRLATLRVEFSYALCCLGARTVSIGSILQQIDAISQIALTPAAKALLVS